MFKETSETKLELLDDGRINVVIITHYFKDDVEIGQDNWGCCMEPQQPYLEYAKTILNDYYYNIVQTAWTEEVMSAYKQKLETHKPTY